MINGEGVETIIPVNENPFLKRVDEFFTPTLIKDTLVRNKSLWDQEESNPPEFTSTLYLWINEIQTGLHALQPVNEKPKVSIVVPACNEERYILQLLSSLAKQDYRDGLEVIMVDNNSNDDDRAAEWAKKCGVRVIKYAISPNDPNQKLSQIALARQKGLNAAQGTYVLTTDADSIVPNHWVASMIEPMENDQNIACVTGGIAHYDRARNFATAGDNLTNAIKRALSIGLNMNLIDSEKPTRGPTGGANTAFRRADALEIGGYDTRIYPGEDTDLGNRLLRVGKIKYNTEDSGKVRVSPRRYMGLGLRAAIIKGKSFKDLYIDTHGNPIIKR